MKKFLAMMLTAAMVIGSLAVPAISFAEEAADLTGVWYLSKMAQGDEEYDASLLSMMGMTATLELNEDGTAVLAFGDDGTEVAWTYEDGTGKLVVDEDEETFTVEDGALVIADDEMSMTFTREAPEAEEVTLGAAIAEPELADFNGTWTATNTYLFGMTFPMSLLDTVITVEIQDGQVTYYSSSPSVNYEEDAEEEAEEAAEELEEEVEEAIEGEEVEAEEETTYEELNFTIQAELQDGALVFAGGEEENYVSMSLKLHDDGKMTDGYTEPEPAEGDEESEDAGYYVIFEKVE